MSGEVRSLRRRERVEDALAYLREVLNREEQPTGLVLLEFHGREHFLSTFGDVWRGDCALVGAELLDFAVHAEDRDAPA